MRVLDGPSKLACSASPAGGLVDLQLRALDDPSELARLYLQRVARLVSNVRASTSTSRNVNIRSFPCAALGEHKKPSGYLPLFARSASKKTTRLADPTFCKGNLNASHGVEVFS